MIARRQLQKFNSISRNLRFQEPNIDLSQYTTRIGGIGPSTRSSGNEVYIEAISLSLDSNIQTEETFIQHGRQREKSVGPPIEGGFYAQKTYGR